MKPPQSVVMLPFSVLYDVVTRARLAAYRHGVFSSEKLDAPVISVGNLTVGGTGKTPLVEWVCRAIADSGGPNKTNVCILTRGYSRANPEAQVVVSDGHRMLTDAQQAGDEPFLLASNLLGIAAVICNANRVAAGQWAIDALKSGVFVLDDGFQHLRVARDLDIVTIDATNPWGGGELLPHGRLREATSGLSRADCVVLTRCDQVESLGSLKDVVQELVGDAPIFTSRMITSGLRPIEGNHIDKQDLINRPLAAFCGVGNPESFFTHLRGHNFNPVLTRTFPDHHHYQQSEIDKLVEDAVASKAEGLITTAKDAVKLKSLHFKLPCYVMDTRIEIDDEESLKKLIESVMKRRQV